MPEENAPAAPRAIIAPELRRHAEIAALIDRWHFESFNSTRLGHDTEAWNLVLAATQDLKSRLAAFIKET
jgi:hypothetical protein